MSIPSPQDSKADSFRYLITDSIQPGSAPAGPLDRTHFRRVLHSIYTWRDRWQAYVLYSTLTENRLYIVLYLLGIRYVGRTPRGVIYNLTVLLASCLLYSNNVCTNTSIRIPGTFGRYESPDTYGAVHQQISKVTSTLPPGERGCLLRTRSVHRGPYCTPIIMRTVSFRFANRRSWADSTERTGEGGRCMYGITLSLVQAASKQAY